jgi:hypothetical protein
MQLPIGAVHHGRPRFGTVPLGAWLSRVQARIVS